jgi:hypothetical protein
MLSLFVVIVMTAWRRFVNLGRKLCLFVLCETCWQQTMGGQGRCKHSMEKGSKTLHGKYKKGSLKAKMDSLWFWLHLL